jgi:hypothetical protein
MSNGRRQPKEKPSSPELLKAWKEMGKAMRAEQEKQDLSARMKKQGFPPCEIHDWVWDK